ncbi:o-succinylbenzoate synthase [Ferrimicrobium sp.]|uniref:o-succinylbenzoate synthase n=1 Tax=Ferrimicrobium sp. TaxID=2926050 RepID=UPI0026392A89|nr:o-succinylbenzoate synthase [Ferrimicrobium sp.]
MIRLASLRLYPVTLDLVAPFRSAEGIQQAKRTYLLELLSDEGTSGWSEISAQNDPSYWPETVTTCLEIIEHHLAPLLARNFSSHVEIATRMATVKGNQMARASVEMAFFDLWAQHEGVSLSELLGIPTSRTHVPAGVTLSLSTDIEALVGELTDLRRQGYRFFKAKVAPDADSAILELASTSFPMEHLVLDANESYAGASGTQLDRIDATGAALIEQPLLERDFVGHVELAKRLTTPIGLDETISGVDDIITALRLGMAPTINLKPSRVGGYVESLKIIDRCQHEGLHLRIGGMLETGIGRAHNLALASHPAFDRVGDLAASDHYFARDITEPFVLSDDGSIECPRGLGLGRTPDPNWLLDTPFLELHIN